MTEYEGDDLRALFQDADLDHVPTTRDLIGPAVAWGSGRRRRDRWTAAGLAGAAAAVAVTGVVTLRPGGGAAADPTRPASSGSAVPGTALVQKEVDALRPYLPAGYQLTCQSPENGFCGIFVLTSPTGGTSMVQWGAGPVVTDNQSPYDRTPKVEGMVIHKATAQIPLVDGSRAYNDGTVTYTVNDQEALGITGYATRTNLIDPSEIVYNLASYTFAPNGSAMRYSIGLSEMIKDPAFKPGTSEAPSDRKLYGYNPTGPVLSPEQFAQMAGKPGFQSALRQVLDWNQQAMDSEAAQYKSQHSVTDPKPPTPPRSSSHPSSPGH